MHTPDPMAHLQEGRQTPLPAFTSALLVVILSAYLIVAVQYAALTPRWQVPDEPAHYNYIRELAEARALPVLDPGEYEQGYLGQLTSEGFPPHLPIDSLKYESWQPPLYYLLATPIYLATAGDVLSLRFFSVLLGAGVIAFTYLAVREAAPSRPGLAPIAAGFVAFIPQHIAMMAGINNDSLSELLIAVGLWQILRLNNRPRVVNRQLGLLGVVVALALITKSQAYVLVPAAGLMFLLRWRRSRALGGGRPAWAINALSIVFALPLLLASFWWGRNIATYGWPDFMAAIRHDQVVSDQPRTADWLLEYGAPEVLRRFLQTSFQSFWGQFGWMGVPMPPRFYSALGLFSVLLLVGGLGALLGRLRHRQLPEAAVGPLMAAPQRDALLVLATSACLSLGLYGYYNLIYVQHQGRYLFPALMPLSLAVAVSLAWWGGLLEVATRRKIGWVVPAASLAALAALAVFALHRFILPALQ